MRPKKQKHNKKLIRNDIALNTCRYSVNAQIICDMYGGIIALHAGCPGSVSDSTVFQRMLPIKIPKNISRLASAYWPIQDMGSL